jgi:hypothetical protein
MRARRVTGFEPMRRDTWILVVWYSWVAVLLATLAYFYFG